MFVIGADEVGRGCLAGDVYVCALLVPEGLAPLHGVRDSKQLSPAGRQRMYDILTADPDLRWQVVHRSVECINRQGINPATREAYEEAIRELLAMGLPIAEIRVDGNEAWPPTLFPEAPTKFIPHGDALDWVIGAASIIAKVTRDAYMKNLAASVPGDPYGWFQNMGYGTPEHLAAIGRLGLTPLHRTKFCRKLVPQDLSLIEELFGAPAATGIET